MVENRPADKRLLPDLAALIGSLTARDTDPAIVDAVKLHAFDASTGKLLWEFPTNSGILAPPTSFLIDGKQYIAIESGWGGDSAGDQRNLNRIFPGEFPDVPEGGAVWVFAVE